MKQWPDRTKPFSRTGEDGRKQAQCTVFLTLWRRRMRPGKKHYDFQAEQAKRLAARVSDPAVRERLQEMADEFSRYASLLDARNSERQIIH
jgi:hypothetical protein